MQRLALLLLLGALQLLVSSCSALYNYDLDRDSTKSAEPARTFNIEKSLREAQQDADKLLGADGKKFRAAWDQEAGSESWSETVLKFVRDEQAIFDTPADLNDFCPDYSSATQFQKETCWLRIVSAMAFYESGFDPKDTYREANGRTSVGLLMMNPDHCPDAPTVEALKNAQANLNCAFRRMIFLLKRDNLVSGKYPRKRGAASYWSVLRDVYQFQDLILGKKPHIFLFTKTYREYAMPSPTI